MRGINKAIIIGNLGNDPKITKKGDFVSASFSLATSETWKDKETQEKKEQTEWHNIVCFNKLAEIAEKYLKKGAKLYIEGKLKTNKYTDKNGIERWSTKIVANALEMLDSKKDSTSDAPASDEPPAHSSEPSYPIDDDIPF